MAHDRNTRASKDGDGADAAFFAPHLPAWTIGPEWTNGMVRGVLASAGAAFALASLCTIWLLFDIDPGRDAQLITTGMAAAATILAGGLFITGIALALLMARDARRAEEAAAGPAGVVGQGS